MRFLKAYKHCVWVLLFPILIITCMTIEDVIHPDNPQANSTVEITVKLKHDCTGDQTTRFIFAVLAPKEWDLATNADLTLNTKGYKGGDLTNHKLELVPDSDTKDGKTWPQIMSDEFKIMDNYGSELEWVAFQPTVDFTIVNGDPEITGEIKIVFPTTDNNIKVNMGYVYCSKNDGLDFENNRVDSRSKLLHVTGGSGKDKDFTIPQESTIVGLTHPDRPQAGSPVDIQAELWIDGTTTGESHIAFGMLVPTAWDVANTAQLTMSTSGYLQGNITDMPMTVMPEGEKEPTNESGFTWPVAFMQRFEKMGNYGDMEWVVYRSPISLDMDNNDDEGVTCYVKIHLAPVAENTKLFMGYAFCEEEKGFWDKYYPNNISEQLFIGGGTFPIQDYRKDPNREYPEVVLMSTVPEIFRFGDIFSVRFDAEGQYYEELADYDDIRMHARAVLTDGSEKTVSNVKMNNMGGTVWQKYIYPEHFFNVDVSRIDHIYFKFMDKDENVVLDMDDDGNVFLVTQSAD